MRKNKSLYHLLSGCALAVVLPLSAAYAQDAAPQAGAATASGTTTEAAKQLESNVLDEIVVTGARRREESVQSTPVAISAINSAMLERNQATSAMDIAKLVPNLQMEVISGGGSSETLALYLRGFGTGQVDPDEDPAIPVVIDGVSQTTVAGSNIDLFGLDRIEVLRGPQGTLFGKNAPTGVVNVVTTRPKTDAFSGKAQLDYGSFNRIEARLMVNIPIIKDVLAINLVGLKKNMDNYVYNITTKQDGAGGINTGGIRLGVLFTPNSRVTWYLKGEYIGDRSPPVSQRSGANDITHPPLELAQEVCVVAGICSPVPPLSQKYAYASPADANVPEIYHQQNITSNLDIKFDPFTLSSVTGWSHVDFNIVSDASRTGTNFLTPHTMANNYHFSQELRLSSEKGGFLTLGDHLDWVVGAYYDRSIINYKIYTYLFQGYLDEALGAPAGTFPASYGLNNDARERQIATSYALFGHAIYNFNDHLNISFGGRQTWDKKVHSAANGDPTDPGLIGPYNPNPIFGPTLKLSPKWSRFTFEAGAQYKFGRNKMVYYRFAQGYRAGGVQTTVTTESPLYSLVYNPETVNTHEIGLKADWFDRRLRTNLVLFHSKYSNLQRNLSFFAPGPVQIVANAASAVVKGVELETTIVPIDPLTLHFSGGYLHPKYKSFTGFLANGVIPPGFSYDQSINTSVLFPYSPKYTADVGFDYTFDLGERGVAVFSADYNWKSKLSLFDISIPSVIQKSYGLASASLRWTDPSGKYTVTAYGHNIFNKYYKSYAVPALGNIFAEGMPATWGLEIGAKF